MAHVWSDRPNHVWSDRPNLSLKALMLLLYPARGRMNAGNADHAMAWPQDTDRLETAWDRGERCDSRLRGYDAGSHSAGRRYRRDPDCIEGIAAKKHSARRFVRS